MTKKLPSEAQAVQQPSYVTYNFSTASNRVPFVTVLESRSLLSTSGGTGFRTWEAALHLGCYLSTDEGTALVRGKRVLELGSGTGMLSILCARWLGCIQVTATDGDDRVVEALDTNIFLNGLQKSDLTAARLLRWGRALEENEGGMQQEVDIVIGADVVGHLITGISRQIVLIFILKTHLRRYTIRLRNVSTDISIQTYDPAIIPPLISTLRELALINENVEILVAATVRKTDTFAIFLHACGAYTSPILAHKRTTVFPPLE